MNEKLKYEEIAKRIKNYKEIYISLKVQENSLRVPIKEFIVWYHKNIHNSGINSKYDFKIFLDEDNFDKIYIEQDNYGDGQPDCLYVDLRLIYDLDYRQQVLDERKQALEKRKQQQEEEKKQRKLNAEERDLKEYERLKKKYAEK